MKYIHPRNFEEMGILPNTASVSQCLSKFGKGLPERGSGSCGRTHSRRYNEGATGSVAVRPICETGEGAIHYVPGLDVIVRGGDERNRWRIRHSAEILGVLG